jgi:GGL domain
MADLKLRRLTELNNRLREDLERDRIPVSQAAKRSVISIGFAAAKLSINFSFQHHRLHQQHKRLHGAISLGPS